MAKLYYVDGVKMSKLVKKYNVSFSTITDILKRYDSEGQPLNHPSVKKEPVRKAP